MTKQQCLALHNTKLLRESINRACQRREGLPVDNETSFVWNHAMTWKHLTSDKSLFSPSPWSSLGFSSPPGLQWGKHHEITLWGFTVFSTKSCTVLDGYPASLGFPIMHQVHAICSMHPVHNFHNTKSCHPPVKNTLQRITIQSVYTRLKCCIHL